MSDKAEATPPEDTEPPQGLMLTLDTGSTVSVYIASDGSARLKFVRAPDAFETYLALSRTAMDAVVQGWTMLTLREFK